MATKTETENKEVEKPLEIQDLNAVCKNLQFTDDNIKLQPTRKRCVSTSIIISPSPKKKKKEGQNIIPPKKFLLGGSISDPLNLNSLQNEEVNRAMNKTPKSSPLHSNTVNIKKDQVNVIIPRNLSDPLELSGCDEAKSLASSDLKQKTPQKHKHKKVLLKCLSDSGLLVENIPENNDALDFDANNDDDEEDITSPPTKKSRMDLSDNLIYEDTNNDMPCVIEEIIEKIKEILESEISDEPIEVCDIPIPKGPVNQLISENITVPIETSELPKKSVEDNKKTQDLVEIIKPESCVLSPVALQVSPEKPCKAVQTIITTTTKLKPKGNKNVPKFKEKNTMFQYGNYNRYYGYRNADDEDNRLKVLAERLDLFYNKEVLDIGCNIGHVSFSIARDFGAKSVVGMDIDRKLINIARKNVQYYINDTAHSSHFMPNHKCKKNRASNSCNDSYCNIKSFPLSLPVMFGPVDLAGMTLSGRFPFNISFIQGNYVLDSDVMLSMETSKFDVILCLSITKWIHLNWGDEGLKRAFKRMFAQLRPGGTLVVEPQPWKSYGRKKTLTETIWQNYKKIQMRPTMFTEYLLNEVGFADCETLALPYNPSKGFQRPLKLYRKPNLLVTKTVPNCTVVKPNEIQKS